MYQKILAPLDGSTFSECSLTHVKAVATGCGVPKVVVLEVIEPITIYTETREVGDDILQEAQKRNRALVEGYLSKIARDLKKEGIAVETVILTGNPAEEILGYATKNKVDLIIMATHGRAGVTRWVLGSVAERILRHSPVPVLIASPAGCRKG